MTTKCSFSFRCTHAARHTPHTCQKSCREGGAEREGDEEGGTETEEERRRRDGEFVGGEWGSADGMIGGKRQRKSGDFGRQGVEDDGYSRGREERENGGITCYVNERGRLIRA